MGEATILQYNMVKVHSKGDQPWDFFGRNDAKAETPVLWPPHANSWLIGKDSDAGRDWGQEEKGTTEDEMAGWHHRLDGHGFGWTLGVGDAQGSLACCNSWGHKELDTTKRLYWTELMVKVVKKIFMDSVFFIYTIKRHENFFLNHIKGKVLWVLVNFFVLFHWNLFVIFYEMIIQAHFQ